jgi:hypothetical protein
MAWLHSIIRRKEARWKSDGSREDELAGSGISWVSSEGALPIKLFLSTEAAPFSHLNQKDVAGDAEVCGKLQ